MTTRNNSAQRVLDIAIAASRASEKQNMVDTWALVFGVPKDTAQEEKIFAVSQLLHLLYAEVGRVREAMGNTVYPDRLYAPALSSVTRVISTNNLSAPWSSLRPQLVPESFLALDWCSCVLPEDTDRLPEAVRKKLIEILKTLKRQLDSTEIPDDLRSFISRQVDIMDAALRGESIIGAQSIRDGFLKAGGDAEQSRQVFEEHKDSKSIKALTECWKMLKKVQGAFGTLEFFGKLIG